MKLLSVLLLSVAAVAANAQFDLSRDFVSSAKSAKLLLPPEIVCKPMVKEMYWSPSGRYLVVHRRIVDAKPDSVIGYILSRGQTSQTDEIVSYDLDTGKSRLIDTFSNTEVIADTVEFMGNSDFLFVSKVGVADSKNLIAYAMNVATGRSTTIYSGTAQQWVQFILSPTKPAGIAVVRNSRRTGERTITTSLSVAGFTATSPMGPVMDVAGNWLQWGGVNGDEAYAMQFKRDEKGVVVRDAKHRPIQIASKVDFAGRRLVPLPEFVVYEPKVSAPELSVVEIGANQKAGTGPTVSLIPTEKEKAHAGIVCTDASRGILAPKETVIAYVSLGSAYVRKLVPFDAEQYAKLLLAEERMQALSAAKQVGLATLMFAADYDDKYPTNDGSFADKVYPYIKDRNMLNGFVYTFPGGLASGIENPASTELGYINGPGGRAVVYADGHAKWINNP